MDGFGQFRMQPDVDAKRSAAHDAGHMRTPAAPLAAALALGVALLDGLGHAQTARQQVPQFEPDPLWSETLPNKWVTGQVGGVAVDSHDNLWVFHRPDTIPDGEKARVQASLGRVWQETG
jgi:hypothetical protein